MARDHVVERVGPYAVVRLYADGWDDLTPRQRLLAYHLSRAAEAGRDIYWDQVHPLNISVRRLMEGLFRQRAELEPAFAEALVRYTKLLWLNNGFYDDRTRSKFVPDFSAGDLRSAVRALLDEGLIPEALGMPPGADTDAHLDTLERTVFDSGHEPLLTDKRPGRDLLRDSAVNFYGGVGLAEVERWAEAGGERHPLNSRVVRGADGPEEEVWRAGSPDGSVPAGRYAGRIGAIIGHLQQAAALAGPKQAAALERLVDYYRSGDPAAWRRHAVAWIEDRDAVIDGYNGFIEVYKDPRGRKGAFEGVVHMIDRAASRLMAGLAANAAYFEARAPWDQRYKKEDFTRPVATAAVLITATGDGGPFCAMGVNLPNEPDLQQQHGSKSVIFVNVMRAYDRVMARRALDEFALPEERGGAIELGERAKLLMTAMHEVLGHASGAVAPDVERDPSALIGAHYNALEEARAELVALHHIWDPKLIDIGAAAGPDVARVAYQAYARSGLMMLRRVRSGTAIQDDHMRATGLIVEYLIDSGSVERVRRGGRTFHQVRSFDQMRAGVAALLGQVQQIKSTGDADAARALLETYAIRIDPALRDEVVERAGRAGVPDSFAAILPRLQPVHDDLGNLVDVTVHHDEDLAGQMLRLAGNGEGGA